MILLANRPLPVSSLLAAFQQGITHIPLISRKSRSCRMPLTVPLWLARTLSADLPRNVLEFISKATMKEKL